MLSIRTLEWSTAYERDYKREFKTYNKALDDLLASPLADLMTDRPLPPNKQDHKLSGEWEGCRECHLKPDLLLIYEKPDEEMLRLVRLGSHSELFGL
jgi:mRNA interferase YafQ